MLNITGHYGMQWEPEFVSWYENSFIQAECHYKLGNEVLALAKLNETLDGIEQRWQGLGFSSTSIPRYSDLSGKSFSQLL